MNKITPVTPTLYKKSYIDYVCSKLKIEQGEVPPSVYNDVKTIRKYYLQHHRKIPLMIKSHTKYFETIVKPKSELASPENLQVKKDVNIEQNPNGKLTEFVSPLLPSTFF